MLLKKCVAVLMVLCMLFLSACQPAPKKSDSDKGIDTPTVLPDPINLGIPTEEWYSYNMLARCVWDMTIHDNKLYVGCGDYTNNTGGVPVMYCSLDDLGNWQKEGVILDEQIGRFLMLDDKLTIPGWDPKDTPASGTYYQLEDGKWQTHSGLPDGLHNFDLVRYDGKLFAGIGAIRGETPIVVSENGTDFARVPMFRNGVPVDTNDGERIRTYNLWVVNDTLYADFVYENMVENKRIQEVYRYEDGKFIFCSGLGKKLDLTGIFSVNLSKPWSDAVIDDTLFFTVGRLYKTTDMVMFAEIPLPNEGWVYDIYTYEDTMYLLTASQGADEAYSVTVYSTSTANLDDLKAEYTLDGTAQPTSLAVSDGGYFISFGNWNSMVDEQNGTVIYYPKK